jgi:hypothetical protein
MREAWRELMFADENLQAKRHRDPVAAAKRSEACLEKVATRTLKDGSPVHSFRTLLDELSTIVRNTCTASIGQRGTQSNTASSAAVAASDRRVATPSTPRNASTP